MYKIKSPLFYNGNKYSLLDKITPIIKKNKKGTFYDLFGGSGVMSINFARRYSKAIYNEYQTYVFRMFKGAMSADTEKLRKRMFELDEKYKFIINISHKERENLVKTGDANKTDEYAGGVRFIKEEKVTEASDPELLYIASCYSFSNTVKFKKDGLLMSSGGVYNFREAFIDKFENLKNINNIEFRNGSFDDVDIDAMTSDDFVYLDPPYGNTQGNYNKIWTGEREQSLLRFVKKLIDKDIKFAMSNVYKNKGKTNKHLIEFCEKHNLVVHHFKHNYNVNGSAGEADEVLICNYETQMPEQLSFNLF